MHVSITYVDTCQSCYITDHHNRGGEYLLGVAVDNTTTWENVFEGIDYEWNTCDAGLEVPDSAFAAAIEDLRARIGQSRMNHLFDPGFGDPEDYEGDEGVYAWFVVQWSDHHEL